MHHQSSRTRPVFAGLLCFVSLTFGHSALAEFRFSALGSYSNIDGIGTDQDVYRFSISGFLRPVDDQKGPLVEAAFLNRSSSLTYSYSRSELDIEQVAIISGTITDTVTIDAAASDGAQTDVNAHRLSARYVFPDSGWIVGGGIDLEDGETDSPTGVGFESTATSDIDAWSVDLTVGRYLLAQTSVTLAASYGTTETDTDSTGTAFLDPAIPAGELQIETQIEVDNDIFDVGFLLEHVGDVGSDSFRVNLNAGYSSTETDARVMTAFTGFPVDSPDMVNEFEMDLGTIEGWNAGIGGTWYFSRAFGLSSSYAYTDFGFLETNTYSGGFTWFVAPKFELSGSYAISDFIGFGGTTETWQVGLRGRF